MNILVCNDDGIHSEGLIALALMLSRKNHNVTVVAPADNRSGYAHSVTFYKEVIVKKEDISQEFEAWSLSGTPADCSKYGLSELGKKFDLVCGGINRGSNLGTEVQYSGTVAIGLEANCLGAKAIAFSCRNYKEADFTHVAEVCGDIIDRFYDKLSDKFTLNVNIPPLKEGETHNGVKVTPLGVCFYTDVYEYVKEGVYVLTGEPIEYDNPADCDVEWIKKNYVTVTPIIYDKTAHAIIQTLKGKL
ncbi:MAG: 5'/3'-nucleotidase SurE [Clostridia bacterium]|nr:5'/3'-nucleotidase SurE [Clostridia bacterium]